MKLTKIALSKLKAPEKNVRIHTDKQISEFKRSLEMFDQIRPIVVDEDYTILCGNGLYAALSALGRETADCYVITGLTPREKKKLMLADNKIFGLGIDDMAIFEEFIAELEGDLDIPGYDADLLATLTSSMDDLDDMMSGYGIISDETKQQIATTAEKYEANDKAYAEEAEEIKPQAPPAQMPVSDAQAEPEKLERKYVVCPHCGQRIWL